MTNYPVPLFVFTCIERALPGIVGVQSKGLASSLLRSLFDGKIVVFRNVESPLFKVERTQLQEIYVPIAMGDSSDSARRKAQRAFFLNSFDFVNPDPRQWVIAAPGRGLALRNIDHLIPPDFDEPYSSPEVDFYWARAGKDDISNRSATPGLWAVRGEHLPLVLDRWKEAWSEQQGDERVSEEEIWSQVVQDLPLRKRSFEKGEVLAPRIGAVDWEGVSNAAFVTVPDWPEQEAWKFLQALYLGTYLGDETGMMLNILEA